jgi:hypothetical protein
MPQDVPVVQVQWTKWIPLFDPENARNPELDHANALYMYCTDDEPLYIGKAGGSTVWDRHSMHMADKDDIRSRMEKYLGADLEDFGTSVVMRVGHVMAPPSSGDSPELLGAVETLLASVESRLLGRCAVNRTHVENAGQCHGPLMVIRNMGQFTPLRRFYRNHPTPWASDGSASAPRAWACGPSLP